MFSDGKTFCTSYKLLDKIQDLKSNHLSQDVDINELLEDNNYIRKCVWFLVPSSQYFDGFSTHS
jgi:hypothetical protein